MDPDPKGALSSSMLLKAGILTLSFTAIYFYRTGHRHGYHLPLPEKKKEPVVAKTVIKKAVKKKRKTIYLSFDDGPDRGTKNVMAILKEEEVPATLFLIGEHVYGSREQMAIYDSILHCSWIERANHSYSHAFENRYNRFYAEPAEAIGDFEKCADSLGFTNRLIRLPGRNTWRTENITSTDIKSSSNTADSLRAAGFTAIGWDLEWHYNNEQRLVQTDSEMLRQVDSAFARNRMKTKNNLVLLAHDRTFTKSDDSARLHRFISALKQKDEFDFEILSNYPAIADSLKN